MGVLDPKKIVCKRKVFHTSRYPRLEKWNKTRIYPNPITYKGPFENKRNDNFTIPQACIVLLFARAPVFRTAGRIAYHFCPFSNCLSLKKKTDSL